MTNPAKHDATTQPELGFLANHKELLAIRVRPAEFARLLGVSKQTVSTWIRDGKVTINALDGLLDVRRAIQDVLRNTSPGRLRSRVLRQAVTDALELRENMARAEDRAEAAEAALTDARKRIAYLESFIDDLDCMFEAVLRLFVVREAELRATATSAEWAAAVSSIESAGADTCSDDLDDLDADASDALIPRAVTNPEGDGGA